MISETKNQPSLLVLCRRGSLLPNGEASYTNIGRTGVLAYLKLIPFRRCSLRPAVSIQGGPIPRPAHLSGSMDGRIDILLANPRAWHATLTGLARRHC